ncbi:MAG: transposase [Hyphomonadaceae bacterium]
MPWNKTLEEQVFFALRQAEAGTPVSEVCHRLGVSTASFYRLKKVYGGLGLPEIRLVKKLSDENKKLKRLVAYLTREQNKQKDALDLTP